ncbi:MAG: glycosyltransferase family 2 protein [Candidatus Pacearchaeota archaeon]
MIHIIIASYGEPKATVRAINSFLEQNITEEFKIIILDPFKETEEYIDKNIKDKRIEFFLDPGEGKSYALNILFERIYSTNQKDIIILTDGDVYVSKNSLKGIINAFKDPKVGCVTGKPVSLNSRENKYGYIFSLLFSGIDKVRKRLSSENKFFECTGYLFAIRNGVLQGFPLETSEDSIIPYLFWKKGYFIRYIPEAEVYVLNPQNWKDYKTQKIRNIKGHENLNKIAKDLPRTKSFGNEIKEGLFFALIYPKSIKEFFWTIELMISRLYIYLTAFFEIKFKKKTYSDGWRKDNLVSTRPLD